MATENWVETVITNWWPMLVLVVVSVYFMRRYNPSPMWQEHITRYKEHMGRVEANLDRIAAALELVAKR